MPRRRADLGDRAVGDAAAPVQDRHPVAGLLDLGEQVTRHEHGPPLGGQRASSSRTLAHAGRVEPVRGLVEDQQRRVLEHRGGEPSRWRMPSEYFAHQLAGPVGQADLLEHRLDPRRPMRSIAPSSSRLSRPVIVGNSAGDSTIAPDPAHHVGSPSGTGRPSSRTTLRRPGQPEHAADRRRLPRPVRPEEPEHPALGYRQVELGDRDGRRPAGRSVLLAQSLDLDHVRAHG